MSKQTNFNLIKWFSLVMSNGIAEKYSVRDLAQLLDVPKSTLHRWMTGEVDFVEQYYKDPDKYLQVVQFINAYTILFGRFAEMEQGLYGKIEKLRYLSGTTQQEFAELCGVFQQTVSEWELENNESWKKTLNGLPYFMGDEDDDILEPDEEDFEDEDCDGDCDNCPYND